MYSTAKLKQMFTSEQVFIILLCRLYFKTATKEELENYLSENNPDPLLLWKIASVHNIRPILYHVIHLHKINIDERLLAKLKQFYLENQLRNLEQLAICHDVITSLKSKGVVAIPFKGVIFSELYYSNSGLRESTDIDLFISPAAVATAEKILQEKNFTPKLAVSSHYMEYYVRHFKEIVYTAPAKTRAGYSVELHWKLLNYYFGDYPGFEFFKQRTIDVKINNLPFNILEPTADFLAVASNHFVKDLGTKFKYFIDVACLLQKKANNLDNQDIIKIADEFGCRNRFATSFTLIENLLGVKNELHHLPDKVQDLQLKTVLSTPLAITETQVLNRSFLKYYSASQDNTLHKFKFFIRSAIYFFLPTDNDLKQSLTKRKLPIALLAIIRPFRLIAKAIFNTRSNA